MLQENTKLLQRTSHFIATGKTNQKNGSEKTYEKYSVFIFEENETATAAAGKHLRRQMQRRLIKQHNYCSIVTNSLFRMANVATINRY